MGCLRRQLKERCSVQPDARRQPNRKMERPARLGGSAIERVSSRGVLHEGVTQHSPTVARQTPCWARTLGGPVHLRIIGALPQIRVSDVKKGNARGSHGIEACTYNRMCRETSAATTHRNQGVAQTYTQVRVETAKSARRGVLILKVRCKT